MAKQDRSVLGELVVEPGSRCKLAHRDPGDRLGLADKAEGQGRVADLFAQLDVLHNRLWAEATRSVVLVLQGMDAAGKDGTIRRVLSGLNPQGCAVVDFKEPSTRELAHDYLWRVHAAAPARGILGVWNRSAYEDVVTVGVLGLVDDAQVDRRVRQIRDFERMLGEEGTSVVKVFLHISKEEQRERLQARIDDPAKNWKFRGSDVEARARWDEYQRRYEDAITETSTAWAPWFVVPSDRRWVRDVAVLEILVDVFARLDPQIPAPEDGLEGLVVE